MPKSFTTHAIETVAGWIAQGGLINDEPEPFTALQYINQSAEGWTVDVPGPLNSTTRHEGVRLSDVNLRAALILGTSWLNDETHHTGYAGIMTVTEARAIAAQQNPTTQE